MKGICLLLSTRFDFHKTKKREKCFIDRKSDAARARDDHSFIFVSFVISRQSAISIHLSFASPAMHDGICMIDVIHEKHGGMMKVV